MTESEHSHAFTLGAFPIIGVGGQLSYDLARPEQPVLTEHDLEATFGVGVQGDVPLHRFFSIGGAGRLLVWHDEDSTGPSAFIDFAVTPRLRLPLFWGNEGVVPYVQLPIGLAIPVTSAFIAHPGLYVAVAAGAQIFLMPHFGVLAELGWQMHLLRGQTAFVTATELYLQTGIFIAL